MSSRKAARAAPPEIVASLAALLSPARAEASRRNGAKSRGPRTPEGKARSSRNALKHGLCARRHVVVEGECPKAFAAFEAALVEDLAPEGALQTLLAGRIARAAWRLERAEQIEAELFAREMHGPFGDGDLGLALIRDGNGARAFDVLLRYRAAAQAELFRTLRTLKALQVESQEAPPHRARAQLAAAPEQAPPVALPNQPETRTNLGLAEHDARPVWVEAGTVGDAVPARGILAAAARRELPIEPEPRANGGESTLPRAGHEAGFRARLLGNTSPPHALIERAARDRSNPKPAETGRHGRQRAREPVTEAE